MPGESVIQYSSVIGKNHNILFQRLRRRSDIPKHPHSLLVSPLENPPITGLGRSDINDVDDRVERSVKTVGRWNSGQRNRVKNEWGKSTGKSMTLLRSISPITQTRTVARLNDANGSMVEWHRS